MPKKKSTEYIFADPKRQAIEDALHTAQEAVESLRAQLPESNAAHALSTIAFEAIIPYLCSMMESDDYFWSSLAFRAEMLNAGILISKTLATLQAKLHGSSTFSVDDLVNLPSFASRLKEQSRPVDAWLMQQLSERTKAALAEYEGENTDASPLQGRLLQDLNRLSNGPLVYEKQRFADVTLRPETQSLLSQAPQGGDLARLNRLLIEDAYSLERRRGRLPADDLSYDSHIAPAEAEAWPVIIAMDPEWDIRKAIRNPKGEAGMRYAHIINLFGKESLLNWQSTKDPGIFHRIAEFAVSVIRRWLAGGAELRADGLPWMIDYVDPATCQMHALSMTASVRSVFVSTDYEGCNRPEFGDNLEWLSAIRYCLYLELAPEPDRTHLRRHWRKVREEAFAAFVPKIEAEQELHKKLTDTAAIQPPSEEASDNSQLFSSKRQRQSDLADLADLGFFSREDRLKSWTPPAWTPQVWNEPAWEHREPDWLTWWKVYLKHPPETLFGSNEPLTESEDPAVVKLINDPPASGRLMSGFGRCVDAVLEAFLTGAGQKSNLQQFRKGLPRIRVSNVGFMDVPSRAKPSASGIRQLGAALQRKPKTP